MMLVFDARDMNRALMADLVLEVNWCVEVWDLGVDGLADDFSLTSVHE
jgi:hypothetical protein